MTSTRTICVQNSAESVAVVPFISLCQPLSSVRLPTCQYHGQGSDVRVFILCAVRCGGWDGRMEQSLYLPTRPTIGQMDAYTV